MATNSIDIIIRAKDEFSRITAQANAELQKLAVNSRNSGAAFDVLSTQTKHSTNSFHEAREASHALGEQLGIAMPRYVSSFLASSALIGPALSAAFSTIAVIGFVQVLLELPEAFKKLEGAVTGWDEAAKKAYDDVIKKNDEAVAAVERLKFAQIDLKKISEEAKVGQKLENLQQELAIQQRIAAQSRSQIENQKAAAAAEAARISGGNRFLAPFIQAILPAQQGQSIADLTQQAATAQGKADELAKRIREMTGIELPKAIEEGNKTAAKLAEDLAAIHKNYLEFFANALSEFKNRTFAGGEVAKEGVAFASQQAKAIIDDWKKLGDDLQRAGDDLIKYRDYWDRQLQEYRTKSPAVSDQVAEGERAADITAKAIIKNFELAKTKSKELAHSIREGAGRVFDDLFVQAQSFGDFIARLFKGIVTSLGRSLFQDLAQMILTGQGSLGSALLGGVAGKAATGGLLGKLSMGGGLLGSLSLGGGAATATAGTLASGAIGILNPATGGLVTGAAAGAGGGIGGALGLGGGAGLLGLGAATIPIIGAAALAAFAVFKLFDRDRREAPFSRDPFEQRSIEYFYNTMPRVLDNLGHAVNVFNNKYNPVPAKNVIMSGMPDALQASNKFRRSMNGVLQDDI